LDTDLIPDGNCIIVMRFRLCNTEWYLDVENHLDWTMSVAGKPNVFGISSKKSLSTIKNYM
jgi:hypothetical protein